METKISIIVCTYNRALVLRDLLNSLLDQTLSSEQYEIVVVDNASTDNTKQIVENYCIQYPSIRYIYEPHQGLSNARNRGVREASAEVIAFIDDDAIADRHWAEEMYGIFELDPAVGAVGGKINLLWLIEKPAWLNTDPGLGFGHFDLGQETKTICFPVAPLGGNCSIRRSIFEKVGGFATNLGRKGNNLLSGEESEFFYRMSLLHSKVMYHPKAIVAHKVMTHRISRTWILKRNFAGGVTSAIVAGMKNSHKNRYWFFASSLRAGFKAVYYLLKIPVALVISGRSRQFSKIAASARLWGNCYQNFRIFIGQNTRST